MDTLYWNNLNSNIIYYNTSKQYFRKYLWRLAVHADGSRLLVRNKKESLESALEYRKNLEGYWIGQNRWIGYRRAKTVDYDLELLKRIERIKHDFAGRIQIRVEEPSVQFYAQDEETLKEVAVLLAKPDTIKDVTGPASLEEAEVLKTGAILTHRNLDYNYKIILRDGRYTTTVKQQVLGYLDSLGEEVKVSPGSRAMLNKTYPSMWGVYFYAKDPGLATFITLIDPNLVSNIHELVPVDNK